MRDVYQKNIPLQALLDFIQFKIEVLLPFNCIKECPKSQIINTSSVVSTGLRCNLG